ncbi:unnamed protein product, partial [Choristocarpus tenellus]
GRCCAYVTLLYTDDYLPGVVALAENLRAISSPHPLLVLVPKQEIPVLSVSTLNALMLVDVQTIPVPVEQYYTSARNGTALGELGLGVWLKLHLWSLGEDIDSIVFLDADVVLLDNIDELFEVEGFGAVGGGRYFGGSVLVLQPSGEEHSHMLESLRKSKGGYIYGEQDFLNLHFAVERTVLPNEYR